jgi:hypothetical protein
MKEAKLVGVLECCSGLRTDMIDCVELVWRCLTVSIICLDWIR